MKKKISLNSFHNMIYKTPIMKEIKFLFVFFTWSLCSPVWGQDWDSDLSKFIPLSNQRYISGRITDANDGSPIPAATVFFTNTTVGITTDLEGNYRLRIPGEGSYSMTVSHVGYQSVVYSIRPGTTSLVFDAAMQIQELDEIEVATRVQFRRRDINLFWNKILGKTPSGRTIQATNPETVYYYYNAETQILTVTCREPLQIVNYEMGYHIQYVLLNFTHDYNTNITDWSHQCVYTELEPENLRQKSNWEKKREEIYKVSLTKFIKALYNNSLFDDGFVLTDFRLTSNLLNPLSLSIVTQDSILSTVATDNSKTLNLSDHQILLFCYGKPVTDADLERLERSYYSFEQMVNNGLYQNLLQGESIHIFPDGTYMNRLEMTPINSVETLFGLSMRLPLDYLPQESVSSEMAAEAFSEDNQRSSTYDFTGIDQQFNEPLNVSSLDIDLNKFIPFVQGLNQFSSQISQEKVYVHFDNTSYY